MLGVSGVGAAGRRDRAEQGGGKDSPGRGKQPHEEFVLASQGLRLKGSWSAPHVELSHRVPNQRRLHETLDPRTGRPSTAGYPHSVDQRSLFKALGEDGQRLVHFALCEHALRVREDFIRAEGPLEYRDCVVGLAHVVDAQLPRDALQAARPGLRASDIKDRYVEPVVSMQDDDLEFPRHIEFAYYAIYNLFQKYVLGAHIEPWLIVNQACTSELDEDQWHPMLEAALAEAESR